MVTRARLKFSALSSSPHSCTVTSTVARATPLLLQIVRASVPINVTPTFFSPKLTSSARWFKSSPVAATQNPQTHHHVSRWPPHPRPPCGHLWRRRARIARAHALICDAVLRTERMRLRQEVCRRLQSLQCAAHSHPAPLSVHCTDFFFFFFSMCATS